MTRDETFSTDSDRPRLSDYPLKRLVFSVLFLALLWLGFWAALFIAIAQFAIRIFDEDASDDLRRFGARLGRFMGQAVAYMTFARVEAPFPFSRFPSDDKPL